MNGSDHPDNIIEVTIEEHAEFHRLLYEKHNKKEDRIAWLGLSGQVGKRELTIAAQKSWRENNKERHIEIASSGGKISGPLSKGRSWYTDGINYKACHEIPDSNWVKCNAPNNVYKYVKGTSWWNNGISHKRSIECPGKGWFLGRINNGSYGGDRRSLIYKENKDGR